MGREKLLLNHNNDLEASRHEPSSPRRVSQKMVRVLSRAVTRKYWVLLCIVTAVLYFTHRSGPIAYPGATNSPAPLTTTVTFTTSTCPTNDTNPEHIVAPPPADRAYLNALWNSLSKNFAINAPNPKHVDMPKQPNGAIPPVGGKKLGTSFPFDEQQARDSRLAHERVVSQLPDYPATKFKGRGIVVLAGGRYSEYAATSLGVLRAVGSKLPVEVWMAKPTEEPPHWCEELEREGMTCRRLSDYMDLAELKHPYTWKVFTLLYSSFSEILFLDADSMPMKNPDYLFTSQAYTKNGAILWPDYWNNTGSPWAPYVIGLRDQPSDAFQDLRSVESGQMVWNKERHWKSLLLAAYYNYWGPDFYYTLFNNGFAGWGDKETFPFALQTTNEEYSMVQPQLGTAFVSGTDDGIGMLQADPSIEEYMPLFMHSNMVKWSARKFFCADDECRKILSYDLLPSHYSNKQSPIYKHLTEGRRIFKLDTAALAQLDPEPYMWRAMERTACRSNAYGEAKACDRVRAHITRTFGYRFEPVGPNLNVGPGNQMCLRLS